MQYTKTAIVPIHYETTKKKLSYLDNLTARLTYCVRLWSEIIEKHNINNRKELQNLAFQHRLQKKTILSSAFVQQCGNKALWMWKQYRTTYKKWEWKVKKSKEGTKYHEKLLKREPSIPFSNSKSLLHKVPVRFDYRTGKIDKAGLEMSEWVINISILKKYEKITIFLNASEYHNELLEEGEIRDFEIMKRDNKYYVHITCQFEVKDTKPKSITTIDLGINRSVVAVQFSHSKEPKSIIIEDKEKQDKLQFYNDLVGELRREEKWDKLKVIRNKRRHISEYYDWITAKKVAEFTNETIVVIGKLTHIRERQYKGNENKEHRKRMHKWAYERISGCIQQKVNEKGIEFNRMFESWTSKKCSNCGSYNTTRPVQEAIFCYDCLQGFDADMNACPNMASRYLSKNATDELAITKDDLKIKPSMSLEAPCESWCSSHKKTLEAMT